MLEELKRISDYLNRDPIAVKLNALLDQQERLPIYIEGLCGSRDSFLLLSSFLQNKRLFLVVCADKEEAAYMLDDLNALSEKHQASFFPDSFRRPLVFDEADNFQVQQRVEVLQKLGKKIPFILVTYPELYLKKFPLRKAYCSRCSNSRPGMQSTWI
ncbi:MAG: hypothetical protein IPM34_02350 [Saprospiraceae bacterium]|nr:hypothetical protein [Saprospiraceae bacterium]